MIWVLMGLYIAAHAARLTLAWRHLRAQPAPTMIAPVILQPILSGDPDLPRCLAATLRSAPEARVTWLIDTDDAQAQRIAADLACDRVTVTALPPPKDGENPKLKKLIAGTPPGDRPLVVLDDDTILHPGGAARLAARAREAKGLATAIPTWGRAPRNAAEALVAGFIDGQGVSTYFAMSALGRNRTINGMAYGVDAPTLSRLGGFAAAGHEVTDDWAVARLMQGGGAPLVQTAEPALVAVSLDGLGGAWALLRRWMQFAHRYMAANADGAMLALVLLPGLLPLAGLIVAVWTGLLPVVLWLALLLGRAALHGRLVRAVSGRAGAGPVACVAAELLLPLLSLAAAWRPNRIRWRSRDMRIDGDTIRFR